LVIASGYTGSSYTWTVPYSLKPDGYEFEVDDGVSADYSPRIQYPQPTVSSTATSSRATITSSTEVPNTTTSTGPSGANKPSISTSSSPTPTPTTDGSGLSTAAKAGIGAGAGVAGLAILGALACLLYRRARANKSQEHGASTINTFDPSERTNVPDLATPPTSTLKPDWPGGQPSGGDIIGTPSNRAELASWQSQNEYQRGAAELSSETYHGSPVTSTR